ncbi:MAG TPA: hypothetical protein VFW38_09500 [Solirubrobacteraceae bacterium]|nr:hypothetical protein [Solirubrobacteraceae bacterium]
MPLPLASPVALAPPAEPVGGVWELVEPAVISLLLSTCPPGVVADDELLTLVTELELPELLLEAFASDVAVADSCRPACVFGSVAMSDAGDGDFSLMVGSLCS